MNEEQEKLIDEQFKSLPKNNQRAIALSPWRFNIEEIGKSLNLTPEQIKIIERETMFVIYGLEPATDYIQNLTEEADMGQNIAEKIAELATEKIFEPILNKIDELDKSEITETDKKEENYMIPSSNVTDPKDEAIGRLEEAANLPETGLEIASETHPQTIPGEIAHNNEISEVAETPEPSITIPPKVSGDTDQPKITYPGGQDPYREPIE
jgi:hypothetical protein